MENKKEQSYGFYSKILNKPFDNLEELKKAEKEYSDKKILELQKSNEKKTAAKKVEDARLKYVKLVETNNTTRKQLKENENKTYQEYMELRNAFIDKYGFYHCTFTKSNSAEGLPIFDEIESILDYMFR